MLNDKCSLFIALRYHYLSASS